MEAFKGVIVHILLFLSLTACADKSKEAPISADEPLATGITGPTKEQIRQQLEEGGYQTFDYVDERTRDTIIMQQYFIAFLKKGPKKSSDEAERDSLQALHLAHLGRMYELGFADISGPFGDDGDIRGITIYNTPTLEMADSLARLDPLVRMEHLTIEVHPWWAAKGFPLR